MLTGEAERIIPCFERSVTTIGDECTQVRSLLVRLWKRTATQVVEDIVYEKIVYDGDLVLVMDEPLMLEGINKDCAIVLNLDEKMTAKEEPTTKEHIADLVCRTMISLIGECSNAATCYHNKPWKSEETKKRYERNIDILSIVNSFAIDFFQSLCT